MAINKIPKNYYSDTNIRRDKINEIIDEVNDIASIPSPSAADTGKVVKVSGEGSYELAQDAGAKELIVTLSNNFTADKTYAEILTALNSGDIVKVIDWTGRNYIYSGMTSGRICFAYLNGYPTTNETDVYTLAVDDTNSWNVYLDTIEHLPNVSSADAGKVLTVSNNGAWESDNIPSELPTVTSADDGSVLGVVNGEWDKIVPPDSYTQIILTPSAGGGGKWDLPNGLTRHDIFSRVVNGELIMFKCVQSTDIDFIPVTNISLSDNVAVTICFSNIFYDGSNVRSKKVMVDDTNDTFVRKTISGEL